MKAELDQLREAKRRELARASEILFAECEAASACGTMSYERKGDILKVILSES
jgi:hypothetical protein